MVVEMRTYKLKPGMRERFLQVFRTQSIPEHQRLGMKILGPFLSIEEPDTFFFMRGFPDLPSREPLKESFYEGELGTLDLESVVMLMIDPYDVLLVNDPRHLTHW